MIRFRLCSLFAGVCLTATLSAAPPESARKKGDNLPFPSSEVQKALEAELAGNNSARNSVLTARLSSAPDDVAARWHSGQVRVGRDWARYDQVADHGDRWKEMYQYREERAKKQNNVKDHLFLADGSREHKLFDEEQAHLHQVVSLDPQHAEAHTRLGDVQVEGYWMSRESVADSIRAANRLKRSHDKFGATADRVVRRLRQLSGSGLTKALKQLDQFRDPEAIPALETAVGDFGDAMQSAYVTWLSEFPCYEASQGLVRQAVFSDHPSIRLAATESLKSRPYDDYMRDLVASLTMLRPSPQPVTYHGQAAHFASFSVESLERRVDMQFLMRNPIDRLRVLEAPGIVGFLDRHEEVGAAAMEVWQASLNARVLKDETRAARALRVIAAVGEIPLANAEGAWDWWKKLEDGGESKELISMNYDRPWYVDRNTRRVERAPNQILRSKTCPPGSCLAAGTKIVTESGSRPVEEIEVGDRVLAQDIETGELTYRPVLARTMREKAALSRLKTAGSEIVCSQGHPFWVNSNGWVQARHLQAGMPLHGLEGSLDVVSIEPAGEGTVYNLVVAETHSYFVGAGSPILSHDITPRSPTNAIVPGLQPLWMVPDRSGQERPVTVR